MRKTSCPDESIEYLAPQSPPSRGQVFGGFKTTIFCGLLLLTCLLAESCRAGHRQDMAPDILTTLRHSEKPKDWYRSAEGRQIADNILTWQSPQGSWPKNVNTKQKPYTGDPNKIEGTFDNGATTGELRFLARAFRATGDKRYEQAFLKGLDHILEAQYPTGGWPQYYPPAKDYSRHITFNDGTMVQLMHLLHDVAKSATSRGEGLAEYEFVDAQRCKIAKESFNNGIECILKCQIRVNPVKDTNLKDSNLQEKFSNGINGKLTVWCAQHDEVDYSARPGRTYELVSLSGRESAGILLLLMSLDNPSTQIIEAVKAGVEWFESAKITGIRQIRGIDGDRVIVEDPNDPPLWARFYEIGSNQPIFAGRDGIKKYTMAEIEAERRKNYAWYGDWGKSVAEQYEKWKEQWPIPHHNQAR